MTHNEHYNYIPKEFQPETFGNLIPISYSLQDIFKRLVRLETKGEKVKDCKKIIHNWNVFKELNFTTFYSLNPEQEMYLEKMTKEYNANTQVSSICGKYVEHLSAFIIATELGREAFYNFMETELIPEIKEIIEKDVPIDINKIMRAFDTLEELRTFEKAKPVGNCSKIPTDDVVRFVRENQGKFFFLRGANLQFADLRWANLRGSNLCFVCFLCTDLEGAKIDAEWHFKLSEEQLKQINQ